MKNIVIAGASGFIGTALVRRLLDEDVHIWTLERQHKYGSLPESPKITRLEDNSDFSELKQLFDDKECDAFYNFAWQGVNGPEKTKYDIQTNNIMLTLRYAELAHLLGCKKYLCAGTIAERAIDSLSRLSHVSGGMMYSASKMCSHIMLETFCKNICLNFVWMQFANIYGPHNKTGNLISYTLEKLKNGEIASFGPAKQPYDFLYIDDLIEAVCLLGMYETNDSFFYIGSGTPRILKEYLIEVGEVFGRPDLIHIGAREDDGIRYCYDMMDSSKTIASIGNYISDSFSNHIKYTIENY